MATIKIKRGNKANLPVLQAGEPAIALDTGELFVGTNSGNKQIGENADTVDGKHATDFVSTDSSVQEIQGAKWFKNGFSALGTQAIPSFTFSDSVNVGMELGRRDGTGGTPYIDFHTDGLNTTDFNTRLIASAGNLDIFTAILGINGNAKITGNLTLKGTSNFGNKINFGDGDYVHISEVADNTLELKGTRVQIMNGSTKAVEIKDNKLYVNGSEITAQSGGSFNFDDVPSGHEYGYSKSGNVTTETIKVTATQAVYATRTTTKNSATQYTIRTICAAKSVDKTEVWTKTSGTWKGVVT